MVRLESAEDGAPNSKMLVVLASTAGYYVCSVSNGLISTSLQ